jgi:hypothetical protein
MRSANEEIHDFRRNFTGLPRRRVFSETQEQPRNNNVRVSNGVEWCGHREEEWTGKP